MAMIEQLASRVLQARNIAHREHLKTESFAKHEALGGFYDSLVPAIDEIIEVYQGRYGLIGSYVITDKNPSDVNEYILQEAMWIENNRNKFATCPAVQNLIDGLVAIYLRTSYKLTNLQ